jgi:tape measure domain-containing protein
MAEYRLEFSTNASQTVKELQSIIASVAKVEKVGGKIVFDLDTSRLSAGIDATFRKLNRQIENSQRVLNKLQIGGPNFQRVAENLGTRQGLRERGRAIAEPIQLRAQSKAFEEGSLVRFSKELQALQIEASQIKPNSQEWVSFQQQIGRIQGELKKADQAAEAIQLRENLGAFRPGSLDQLSARLKLLKIEANAISPSTDKWKAVNAEIQKTEKGIQRISKKPLTAGQRAGAAGGAFLYGGGLGGGAGSALGGIAGGLAGGVPGAFAGAAVGQLTDNLIAQAAAVAKISAEYNKSRIALAGVTSSQADFDKALNASSSIGQKFLLPITDATKQFTKLQASVRGAGYDTETTVKAFNGISSAIIATGGSTEDLNGALLATSQVFSKGKVSAEELRQQIGERLAGAFTIFADSSGIAAKELDKLLSKGEVTLDDFVKFLDELGKRYGTTADLLASAPENAGPRLAVAIQSMQLAYGGFFQRVGAGFQAYATDLINFAIANQKGFQQVVATVAVAAQDIYNIFSGLIDTLIPPLTSFFKFIFDNFARGINALSSLADESRRAAGGPEQRAAASVEALYPNLVERALVGAKAYQEALSVELAKDAKGTGVQKTQQQRIDEMMKTLFAPYQPSKFGAALSTGGTKGGGLEADADAKKKQQSLESYHSLQDQLAKNFTQDQLDRMEQEYQARVNRINSEFDLREARANSFQKEAINFERQISDIELKRQKALLDASAEVIKAQGSVAGGAGGQSTTGTTGLLQGSTGISSGAHFDVRRQDGSYISPEQAKALFDPSVRRQLAMTSAYGPRRAPVPGASTFHKGVDLAGPANTPLNLAPGFAMTGSGEKGGLGYAASVRGPSGEMYDVGHLQRPKAGMGTPRKVTGDEKRDVIADQKAQLAVAQQSLTVRNADAQAIRDAAVAWAQYTAAIVPVEEQALQNNILAKKNELVKASMPEDVIEKELQYFEAQQKTSLAMENNDKLLAKGTIDQKEHANRLLELKTRLAGYNTELDRNIQLQRQQSFDASMTALNKQMELAGIIDPRAELRARISQEKPGYTPGQVEEEAAAQERIAQLEASRDRIRGIASSIGDAFGTAFKGIITGSMTAQEALAGMFQSIADSFADMVAQMIAEWLKAQLIRGFQSLFSAALPSLGATAGGLSSAFGAAGPTFNPAAFTGGFSFANGGIASGGFTAFANGGMVTGPTMGLVGEGKYNEAIVPLPDGRSIPVQMKGPGGGGLREAMSGNNGKASGSPILNMSFQSTNINGVEYVSRDQLEAAMATTRKQAAKDGANRGMTMTLDKLQQSPQTRTRLGMG